MRFKPLPRLSPNSSFATDHFKAAFLLQFFVCASAVSCGVGVGGSVVLICSSYLLPLVPREGCAT